MVTKTRSVFASRTARLLFFLALRVKKARFCVSTRSERKLAKEEASREKERRHERTKQSAAVVIVVFVQSSLTSLQPAASSGAGHASRGHGADVAEAPRRLAEKHDS